MRNTKIIGKLDAIHFLVEDAYGGVWVIDHLKPWLPYKPLFPFYDLVLEEPYLEPAA